jgi:hypothetical protein
LIVDSPSKIAVDPSLPFPIMVEAAGIQKSGDSQTGNFYMKQDEYWEESRDFFIPPAVICRFGETARYEKILLYDNTGKLYYR